MTDDEENLITLTLATNLLALGGCFSADPRGVIRAVESLEPHVEERDRQLEELTNPEAHKESPSSR